MRNLTLISLGLIFLLSSCKKEVKEEYPVIFPGSYYPVYPDSWWKYMDKDSVITIDSAGSAYQLNNFVTFQELDDTRYSDPCYVPFLNGHPIYHYDKVEYHVFPIGYERWPILSEEIGFQFQRSWIDPRNGNPVEIVVVKGKYFNGTDSVLVQEGHYTFGWDNVITRQEFVKNVGLVTQVTIDTISNDTISGKFLVDYYISFNTNSIDW
jgi:hypothetical protein